MRDAHSLGIVGMLSGCGDDGVGTITCMACDAFVVFDRQDFDAHRRLKAERRARTPMFGDVPSPCAEEIAWREAKLEVARAMRCMRTLWRVAGARRRGLPTTCMVWSCSSARCIVSFVTPSDTSILVDAPVTGHVCAPLTSHTASRCLACR
jgi:hypothetical protein